ncbi:MAG TPA: hypothetical protein VI636_22615 [Candidatus Angelobacter sp.]
MGKERVAAKQFARDVLLAESNFTLELCSQDFQDDWVDPGNKLASKTTQNLKATRR